MAKFIQIDTEGLGPQWVNVELIQQVFPHGQSNERAIIKMADGASLIFKGSVSQAASLLPQ